MCVSELAACCPNRTQMSVYYKKGRVGDERWTPCVDVDENSFRRRPRCSARYGAVVLRDLLRICVPLAVRVPKVLCLHLCRFVCQPCRVCMGLLFVSEHRE